MPTTIDSLQIEIQSNSTNAAQAIDALATSLGNLKRNGAVDTAITNLGTLSDKLRSFTDAANASRAIGKLSGAMERLKNVGSVASVGNSLTKLSEAIGSLGNVNLDGVDEKIKNIANAVAPLSNIKSGGLGTMVNALGKIGDVTASLDDSKIAAFADRVSKLNEVLEPLSTRMTTVQAGLRGINSSARLAGASTRDMGEKLNTASVNLASFIHNVQKAVHWVQTLVQKFSDLISDAIEWDGVSARFGRGFGPQAEKTYKWVQKLNEKMGINTQQFMQYSSVYATMLSGFGVAAKDASEMALGYTELTYDIWAGYNDIYKTYSDAADAVKSAIAGEVEPIRRAGFTIIESTLAQTAANHGLEISLANATEAQKSYLRYLTLVDQAHSQNLVGTYARELGTAEGLVRTLSQQLKSLAQTVGSLLLPILARVIPYVQAFVELLTEGVIALASIFGIEIQGVDWSSYNSGVSDATDGTAGLGDSMKDAASAAKELQNATIGIDELNVISPPSGSGGGGGGGAGGFEDLDVNSLWDESIFDMIQTQVDEIKSKFKDWLPVIKAIGAALGLLSVSSLLASLGDSLAKLGKMEGQVASLQRVLAGLAILTIEAVLVFMLSDEYLETGNLLPFLGEILAEAAGGYLMYKGFGNKGLIMSLAVSMLAELVAITLNLSDGGVKMNDPQLWVQSAFTAAKGGAAGGWLAYKGLVNMGVGRGIGFGVLAGLSLSLAAITIGKVTADGNSLTTVITGALSTLLGGAAGAGILSALGIASGGTAFLVGAAVMLAVNLIGVAIGKIKEGTKRSMEDDLESRFGEIELSVDEIEVFVDRLTPAWADETAMAVSLREDLSSLLESVENELKVQENYEWRVSVGLELTEEEMGQYKASIDRFVSQSQQYIVDRGYALEIGLKATGADESVIESAITITNASSAELEKLGKRLQDTVNAAYEDGLLDIDELKAIQTIRGDIQTIVETLSNSNMDAEFGMLEMKWSGIDLTADSFKALMQDWDDTLDNQIKPELESTVKENLSNLKANVAFAKLQYQNATDPGERSEWKDALDEAEAALQEYLDQNPLENLMLEASIKKVNFALNTLRDNYRKELELARTNGWFDYDLRLDDELIVTPNVEFDIGEGEIYGNLALLANNISASMQDYAAQLSDEARKSLEEMLDVLKPSMEDYEEIAAANRACGATVTQSIRDGLNDYNELLALTGDVQAINYLIGQGFSTDPVFLNTLATVEGAGKDIDASVAKGLLNNLDYVTDEATGVIIGIKNAVTGECTYITPTLEKNLETLGVNMGDALGGKYQYVYDETTGLLEGVVDSVTGNLVWMRDEFEKAGAYCVEGFDNGASDKMRILKPSMAEWARTPWDKFKAENEISSPSKLFRRGGEYLIAGLKNGMPVNSLSTHLSKLWGSARTWWDSKPKLSTYTPNIGSIKDKLSTAWDTARQWWSNTKPNLPAVTPTIGSVKDALSNAWAEAKRWWSENARLTIPSLSLHVSFQTEGLSKVKNAIVKALSLPGWPTLSFAAAGGMFDVGSLIWAGERGAEIVANAGGGKTGVMNVQQMQDAVYEGVYAAMMSALRTTGSSGGQNINVYLDGRQLTAAVEKRQRERGTSLVGSQVYSY